MSQKFKDLFLPVGLLFAMALGLLFPALGTFLNKFTIGSIKSTHLIISLIFVISGYNLKLSDLTFNKSISFAFIAGFIINLILAPCLGYLSQYVIELNGAMFLGLMVICSVPTTLSSGTILTGVAKGDLAWAILFTIGFSILGVFCIPFTLSFFLGSSENSKSVEALPLLIKLCLLVVIPLLLGYLLQKKKPGAKNAFLSYFPSLGIIIIVYGCVSSGEARIKSFPFSDIIEIVFLVISIHSILFFVSFIIGKLMRLPQDKLKPFVFVSSQKTLPLALAVLLSFENSDVAAIVCLLFHFSQIIMDSTIATYWQPKKA